MSTTKSKVPTTFTSKYSGTAYPVAERVDIVDYGPVAVSESQNSDVFTKCADDPSGALHARSDTFQGNAGIAGEVCRVTRGCAWKKDSRGRYIDPVGQMEATDPNGETKYFHCRYADNYYKCYETGNYYTSSTSVVYIEDTYNRVSLDWINAHPREKYFCCEDCGNWYSMAARHGGIDGPEDVCQSCWEDRSHRDDDDDDDPDDCDLINDYGSERYPAHRGKHPRKYGVEMEVEVRGSISDHARTVLNKCVDKQGKFVILKTDGSLEHGFEIVSAPMDFDSHMTSWGDYFAHGTAGLTAWDTGTCGLHIHVTRAELSHLQLGKMIVFVNDPAHKKFIETIAGRDPSRWAAFRPSWKHGKSRGRDSERYSAINLGNEDTVEFRIFRGTVKAATFYKALQFVDALVEYCGPCNRSLSETNDLENFFKFVRKHRKMYPHLDDFLVAKNFLPARKTGKNQTAAVVSVSE